MVRGGCRGGGADHQSDKRYLTGIFRDLPESEMSEKCHEIIFWLPGMGTLLLLDRWWRSVVISALA